MKVITKPVALVELMDGCEVWRVLMPHGGQYFATKKEAAKAILDVYRYNTQLKRERLEQLKAAPGRAYDNRQI